MTSPKIIGLILAGGCSRRMGSHDKAFAMLAGRPLLAHALARLQPQVDDVVINSNADHARFRPFNIAVIKDRLQGHLGPLAGIHAGLSAYPDNYLLSVAVDLPFLQMDLASRHPRSNLFYGKDNTACAIGWRSTVAPWFSQLHKMPTYCLISTPPMISPRPNESLPTAKFSMRVPCKFHLKIYTLREPLIKSPLLA